MLNILTRAEIESLGRQILKNWLTPACLKLSLRPDTKACRITGRADHGQRIATTSLVPYLNGRAPSAALREKLIEMRLQSAVGATRYAMLDHGWERLARLQSQNAYLGPAPVSLADTLTSCASRQYPVNRPQSRVCVQRSRILCCPILCCKHSAA